MIDTVTKKLSITASNRKKCSVKQLNINWMKKYK